jgi:hypothetical protein
VTGSDGHGIPARQLDQVGIGAGSAHEALARRLAKGQTKLDTRDAADHHLVDILDRFDEVGLPQDEVRRFRFDDWYRE